jgi:hypothetical protein
MGAIMFDANLIAKCSDPTLKPAIVEKFIAQAGSPDPLTVTVRAGDRLILVPAPKIEREAMETIRRFVGNAVVRVGVTQLPVGIGGKDVAQLKPELVETCQNIRMGSTLFAKVYRIVVKWYGSSPPEAFDDAVHAWKTGYFEGRAVFQAPDPGGDAKLPPNTGDVADPESGSTEDFPSRHVREGESDGMNDAGIRIDLSRINGGK